MKHPNQDILISDAVLVKQCQQGDSAAIELLILKYQQRIYNVILRLCANADDAAELAQETFLKAIENIHEFEGRSSFYTWVFRIAVNLTLTYRQKRCKIVLRPVDSNDGEQNEHTAQFLDDDRSSNPAEVATTNELGEIALKALMALDEMQRTVLVLRDIEGMNYRQIAEVLNIKLGTVRSKLSRARIRLKALFHTMCSCRATA
jgi:RNA polymerase sigma-70 factor (ECF subfamily)